MVTFDSQCGSDVPADTVERNKLAKTPTPPTQKSCALSGWYTDAAAANPFDFTKPITAHLKLYARWVDAYIIPSIPMAKQP